MKRRIATIPNLLSAIRLVIISPLFFYLAMKGEGNEAFTVGVIGLITDGLDGYIAVKWDQRSRWGSILDTAADAVFGILVAIPIFYLQYIDLWMGIFVASQRIIRNRIYFYVLNRFNVIYKPVYMKSTGVILVMYGITLPMLIQNLSRPLVDVISWTVFVVAFVPIVIGVFDTIKKTKSGYFKTKKEDD